MKRKKLRARAERYVESWERPSLSLSANMLAMREALTWLAAYESGRRDAARKRREGTQILESVKDDTLARAVSRYLQLHGNANAEGDETRRGAKGCDSSCPICRALRV